MKKILSGIMFSLVLCLTIAAPALATTDTFSTNVDAPDASNVTTLNGVLDVVTTIVNWVTAFVLAVAVLMLIIAGFLWMIAGGDQERIKTARKMLIYSLIGIVIVVAAQGLIGLIKSILGA